MNLFYTGASAANQPQPDQSKSLGGYVSNTMVPNDILNNLFGSMNNYSEKYKEYRLIAIKNLTGSQILSAKIWIEEPTDSYGTYQLAAVSPSLDNCSDEVFEVIQSPNAKPYYATFQKADSEANAIEIDDPIENNEIFGLWVERKASQYAIDNNIENVSCESLEEDFANGVQKKESEDIKLIIEF